MKNLLSTLFIASVICIALPSSSTAGNPSSDNWQYSFGSSRSFIENKGQFHTAKSEVLYAFDDGGTMIYFAKNSVTYSFLKRWKKDEEEKDEDEMKKESSFRTAAEWKEHEREEHEMKFKTDVISFSWENTSSSVQLVAEDQTSDYSTYCLKDGNGVRTINNARGFKKLVYKNIYPNIDIEYTLHPESGVKYALILHPGADINLVKLKCSDNISLAANGDLHVRTAFGDIVDHAPVTFYSNNNAEHIPSKFVKEGKSISFELGSYDKSRTVVIDPWTATPALNNSNGIWECEKDAAGNVYIIGGDMPMRLQKYNSAGVLQWSYNTPYDTANYWLGTMATDQAGNSYITAGSVAAMQKINNAGTIVWNAPSAVGGSNEYWNIAFNCDQTKLIVGGTTFSGSFLKGAIFDINTSTGAVLATKVVGYGSAFGFPPNLQEVRSISSSKNARYYFLTLDTIGYIDQSFSSCSGSGNLYKTSSGYSLGYKSENYRPNNGNGGLMAIRANANFVYTQNGTQVHKRDLTTGAIITTATIPGGTSTTSLGRTLVGNSGIDIDSCGYVYVGSGNAVVKYDANLVFQTSVATPFKVYDVAVSYGGNVIVCGATGDNSVNVRTGYVQSISMSTCLPMSLICCNANLCSAGPLCTSDAPINITALSPGGTFSGTGITNASAGTFSPAVSGPGTFTITYTMACGTGSINITVSPCIALTVCSNSGGTYTVSGGTGPYTWQQQTTTTPCISGFGNYCNPFTVAGTPTTSWTTFATGTTVTPPGTFPLQVIDNGGNTVTIANAASVAACAVSCPTLTVSVASQVNVLCFGQSTGSFSASTTGGASPYDYTLLNGATVVASFNNVAGSQSFTGLPAGTYTLNVLDNNACPGSTTITITQPASALSVTSTSVSASCGASNGSATATAGGGSSPYDYVWTGSAGTLQTTNNITTSNTLSALGAGTYTVTITDNNNCITSTTVTITNTGGPSVAITSQTNVLCFGNTTGSATATASAGSSPYDYVWTGTSGTLQTTNNITGPNTVSSLGAGTYTITVTDNSGCTANTTVTITQPASALSASLSAQQDVLCFGSTTGSASITVTGGTAGTGYLYSWSPSGGSASSATGLGANNYTVTVTDANGCSATQNVSITQPASAAAVSVTGTTSASCGSANGSATAQAAGGTGPYDYVWSGSAGTLLTTNDISGPNTLSSVSAGSYTITITDANGCVSTATAVISNSGGASTVITAQTNINCFGTASGSATANSTGGTSPYDYVWTGSSGVLQTTNNITGPNTLSGLTAGTYTVTVTDASGCISTTTVTITGPASTLSASPGIITDATCGASNGTATVNATGGTGPYTYSWLPAGGSSATATSLAAGTYTCTVADFNGCSTTVTLTINNTGGPTLSIAALQNNNCFGGSSGSATINASGGSGTYTYNWTGGGGTAATANNLAAGTYLVTVSDGICSSQITVNITQPPALLASVSTSNANCGASDGSATVTAAGGTGTLTYSWSPVSSSSTTLSGIPAGNYTVTVTDSLGCMFSANGTVNTTGGPTANAGIDVTITAGDNTILNGNPSGATYSWSPSSSLSCSTCENPTASPLTTTTYVLTVTQNGCSDTDSVTVFVDVECGELFVPNAFSPNGDNQNDMLYVMGNCIVNLEFAVFDRWGEKVFETADPSQGWDGTYKGKLLDAAVFVYYIRATVNGIPVDNHGNITLIK
jgi:gliding motility-associated-like protein